MASYCCTAVLQSQEVIDATAASCLLCTYNNKNNKRPLTPESMPPTGDEHAELKTNQGPKHQTQKGKENVRPYYL